MLLFLVKLIFTGKGANEVMGPVGTISLISEYIKYGAETILRAGCAFKH